MTCAVLHDLLLLHALLRQAAASSSCAMQVQDAVQRIQLAFREKDYFR